MRDVIENRLLLGLGRESGRQPQARPFVRTVVGVGETPDALPILTQKGEE